MLPLVGVPQSLAQQLAGYRDIFCREEGFEHVSRYLSGLLLSPNKTLQGIYGQQVWESGKGASRRAMHAAVFEAGWDCQALMQRHRQVVSAEHQGQGPEVISLDWTLAHHERGPAIFGAVRAYDYVNHCMSRYQTVVTAVIANRGYIDGLAAEVQRPDYREAERAYLRMSAQASYEQMEQIRQRLIELLHHQLHCLSYRKRTEMAVEIVKQLEAEGQFPQAHYAFDNGVLTLELTCVIEAADKHWVSELECSRLIQWQGQWTRVGQLAAQLRQEHPESFRPLQVQGRNGDSKAVWAFSKVVRLKRYGRKRLVIVHEQEDLSDAPRFLLSDALHWEMTRVLSTWSYRWPCEVFHQFCKQVAGLESAQLRKEEAVRRHFHLSCIAQSLLQRLAPCGGKSERFTFAQAQQTLGQKLYSLGREALAQLLEFAKELLTAGQSTQQILELLMPT